MTALTALTAAGYIVADNSTIYGAGATEDAALADARQWMHRSDDGTDPTEGAHRGIGRIAGRLYVAPATSALIDYVTSYAHGGAPVWADRDGVCCTQDEADAFLMWGGEQFTFVIGARAPEGDRE